MEEKVVGATNSYINNYISSNIFPNALKIAIIVLMFKRQEANGNISYQPIVYSQLF